MSIKTWFNSLAREGKPTGGSYVEHLEKWIEDGGENVGFYKKRLEAEYPEEIERLKRILQMAFKERKTPMEQEFREQLVRFSDACEAKAHQKLLGVSPDSEMSKIILEAWRTEYSKLVFLCFDDVRMPMDEVEEKIKQYKERV